MSSYLVNRGLRISVGSGKKQHMRHGYWIELQWDPRVSGPFCVSLSYFSRCWGVSIWNTTDDNPQVEKVYDDSKMKVTSLELRRVYDSSTFSSDIYSFECEVLYLPQGAIPNFRVLWGLLGDSSNTSDSPRHDVLPLREGKYVSKLQQKMVWFMPQTFDTPSYVCEKGYIPEHNFEFSTPIRLSAYRYPSHMHLYLTSIAYVNNHLGWGPCIHGHHHHSVNKQHRQKRCGVWYWFTNKEPFISAPLLIKWQMISVSINTHVASFRWAVWALTYQAVGQK